MFHVLLLEQDTIKKERMNNFLLMLEFKTCNNKKYELEIIWDNEVYDKEIDKYLLGLYYLVA